MQTSDGSDRIDDVHEALISAFVQHIRQYRLKIFAISGAQGSGKTTLAAALQRALQHSGNCVGVVSLDDYYLSRQERAQLAEQVHPLLINRGVPGSHHISRLQHDVTAHLAGQPVTLPRFDKAQDDVVADVPPRRYDVLIIEGWCLGALPQSAAELAMPVNDLDFLPDAARWRQFQNDQLQQHYQPLWPLLQPMLYLQAPDWPTVCGWRQQQEAALWRQRGTGMDAPTLMQFMLPFQRITEAMLRGELAGQPLLLALDKHRQIRAPLSTILSNLLAKSQN